MQLKREPEEEDNEGDDEEYFYYKKTFSKSKVNERWIKCSKYIK